MRKILHVFLITAGLAGFGALAHAQYGPPGGPYQPDSVNTLVEKVHTDLNGGYAHWRLSNGDRNRLNNAEKRLRGFAADWRHGKFDKGDLDDSIAAIQHVLDNNHLAARSATTSRAIPMRCARCGKPTTGTKSGVGNARPPKDPCPPIRPPKCRLVHVMVGNEG